MGNNNYGSSSLRFSFENDEQKLAYDLLQKIPRKQTQLITALLCNFIRQYNANPYVLDTKELNTLIKAYCKTSIYSLPFSNDTPLVANAVKSKPKKTTSSNKATKVITPKEEIIEETIVENKPKLPVNSITEAQDLLDNDEDILDDDLDSINIDDKKMSMAMANLQGFFQ